MSNWYRKIQQDLSLLPQAIIDYEQELETALLECGVKGNVEKLSREIPGIVAFRFNQLQDLEAMLEHLNILMRKKRSEKFQKYLEHYNRALSSRDAEKYSDGDNEVIDLQHLINELSLTRNKFMGIIKALESKQFQINNVIKLRVAGLDDITL
tara:strand:- start:3268 stop:3726 length:459 start_codon:yes stop_codon:yes gene_type:complete